MGQINRGSKLGEIIYYLTLKEKYVTFLEIGTWDGTGSTKCFLDGLKNRKDQWQFLSIECDIQMFDKANKYHIYDLQKYKNRFVIIYGKIIDNVYQSLHKYGFNLDTLKKNNQYKPEYKQFMYNDLINYKQCPYILSQIPNKLDIVLLDGGEFTTYSEFMILKERTNIFILDDSNVLKNTKTRYTLQNDSNWQLILNSNDRNGYCVFERINND